MNEKNPKKNQNPISEENLSKILKKPKEIQRPLKARILIVTTYAVKSKIQVQSRS
jgi:hypothetical protein